MELAYRLRRRDAGLAVYWVTGTSPEAIENSYITIAQSLRLPTDVPELTGSVRQHLSQEESGRWLIILDDVGESPWKIDSAQGQISLSDYLPRSELGSIIFTTRTRLPIKELQATVEVRPMDSMTATTLFGKLVANTADNEDGDLVPQLISQLGNLPLAIAMAAAFIRRNGLTISEGAKLYNNAHGHKLRTGEFKTTGFEDLLTLAIKNVQAQNVLASDYLSLMAFLHADDIPRFLLPPGRSKKEERDAISLLMQHSFIVKHRSKDSFSIHRLLQVSMRTSLEDEGKFQEWLERTLARLVDVIPGSDVLQKSHVTEFLPHALHALGLALPDSGRKRYELLEKVALCRLIDGDFSAAESGLVLNH